eukprot:601291-Pyramimonas_sp.AAC.1
MSPKSVVVCAKFQDACDVVGRAKAFGFYLKRHRSQYTLGVILEEAQGRHVPIESRDRRNTVI